MPETLSVTREGGVIRVTLAIPTMTPLFFEELGLCFQEIAADADARVVVLDSSAKSFSYGLDLPAALQAHGPQLVGGGLASQRFELLQLIRRWQNVFSAVADCPVPTIAAIHGRCIGGGLDLVTACDIRLATADAGFSLRETRIAIVADVGSLQRLPGIVGRGHMRELAFTGRDIDAARAFQMGLVNEIAAGKQSLEELAMRWAGDIAANPPLTVRGVKQVLQYCEDKSVRDGLEYVAVWNSAFLASEDLGEAVSAFMEKREPSFKGR